MSQQDLIPDDAPQDSDEEIREWFMEEFWPNYPADLCGGTRKKGSRGQALKAMLRLRPDKEKREKILIALREQARYDREAKRAGEDVYRWPYAVTYINQGRYDDEVGSYAALREKQATVDAECAEEGCTNKVHGPEFKLCGYHYSATHGVLMDKVREKYRQLGLVRQTGESYEEWMGRVRAVGKEQIRRLKGS